jgi:hypothetical protein
MLGRTHRFAPTGCVIIILMNITKTGYAIIMSINETFLVYNNINK